MTCPNCPNAPEVAYSPVSRSLFCLSAGCDWERHLDEDEIFRLFFTSSPAKNPETPDKSLTPMVVEVSF